MNLKVLTVAVNFTSRYTFYAPHYDNP